MTCELPYACLSEQELNARQNTGFARLCNTDRAKNAETASGGMRTILSVWSATTTRKAMKGDAGSRRDRRPATRRVHGFVALPSPPVEFAVAFVNLLAGWTRPFYCMA